MRARTVCLIVVASLCCAPGCLEGEPEPPVAETYVSAVEARPFVPRPVADVHSAVAAALVELGFGETVGRPTDVVDVESGLLSFTVCDNSRSPDVLSGLASLGYLAGDDRHEAFRAGWNLEHVFSGHRDDHNRFSARRNPYLLCRERGGSSVFLVRLASQDPWSVEHVTRVTPSPPDSIDIDFRCRFLDVSRFGSRGYAGFFWANYMRDLRDAAIHFRGIVDDGAEEVWVEAESTEGFEVGTYLASGASALEFDADHNMALNLRSFSTPRITCPLLISRSANDMVLTLMFDRLRTASDEIRFSSFPPAVDFQYIIHAVQAGRSYGFRARLSWKRWPGREACLGEFRAWQSELFNTPQSPLPRQGSQVP